MSFTTLCGSEGKHSVPGDPRRIDLRMPADEVEGGVWLVSSDLREGFDDRRSALPFPVASDKEEMWGLPVAIHKLRLGVAAKPMTWIFEGSMP